MNTVGIFGWSFTIRSDTIRSDCVQFAFWFDVDNLQLNPTRLHDQFVNDQHNSNTSDHEFYSIQIHLI